MASNVDPQESSIFCIQRYSTLLEGFTSCTSEEERESDVAEVIRVTQVAY